MLSMLYIRGGIYLSLYRKCFVRLTVRYLHRVYPTFMKDKRVLTAHPGHVPLSEWLGRGTDGVPLDKPT